MSINLFVNLRKSLPVSLLGAVSVCMWTSPARADRVTDWNRYTVEATKGFNGSTGSGFTLNSNVSARVEAIAGRAVFDAVNSVLAFSDSGYSYLKWTSGDPQAAAAQAAHDVLLALLPNPALDPAADPRWAQTRAWLDLRLAADLAALGVDAGDGGLRPAARRLRLPWRREASTAPARPRFTVRHLRRSPTLGSVFGGKTMGDLASSTR